MKVKELIEKLNKMNPDLEILCYTEDQDLVGTKNLSRALEIAEVTKTDMKVLRDDDNVVRIRFTNSGDLKPYVLFEITSDL